MVKWYIWLLIFVLFGCEIAYTKSLADIQQPIVVQETQGLNVVDLSSEDLHEINGIKDISVVYEGYGIRLADVPYLSLNLSYNKLEGLPESFGDLSQLQKLDLRGNNLSALPESFGNLTQLQTLKLFNNILAALPESFGGLSQLQTLNLSYNNLTVLPEGLIQLPYLRELDVDASLSNRCASYFTRY